MVDVLKFVEELWSLMLFEVIEFVEILKKKW